MFVPGGSWLILQGAVPLLGDWLLLLHSRVRIEQLKGQAAKLAYFCALSHRVLVQWVEDLGNINCKALLLHSSGKKNSLS